MKAEHVDQLLEMRKHAPNTWRCTSNYYNIAAQYGISLEAEDRERDRFIDESLGLRPRVPDPSGTLSYAELRTILAALREYQRQWSTDGGPQAYPPDCADHFADVEPLGGDEIDSLCERLNCGEIVRITGGPNG